LVNQTGVTALIIDDAVHIRRLVARMLEQAGFQTLEAADGLQGLQVLKEQLPDVVTCDISMPQMDGHEFLAAARLDPNTQHIPIIIVTAMGQEEEAAKATAMGANAYLTKPFSSSHLIETIRSQVEEHSKETYKRPS
jgi:CheY-like chemotaxis protein